MTARSGPRPVSGMQQPDEEWYRAEYEKAEKRWEGRLAVNMRAMIGEDFLFLLHRAGLLPQWPWVTEVTIHAKPQELVTITALSPATTELLDLTGVGRPVLLCGEQPDD